MSPLKAGQISGKDRYAALAAPHLPSPAALQLCASALELAESLGLKGHLPGLLASQADALQRAAQGDEARRCAQRAVRLLESITPSTCRGSIWLSLHNTLTAPGDTATAREVLLQAGAWPQPAARSVPPELRDSFFARNAENRQLMLLATKAAIAPNDEVAGGREWRGAHLAHAEGGHHGVKHRLLVEKFGVNAHLPVGAEGAGRSGGREDRP